MFALLLAGAAIAPLTSLHPQPPLRSDAACRQAAIQARAPADPALLFRRQDRLTVKLRRLGDLPKANYEIAVFRSIDGCAAPVVVRYNVGP